MLYAHKSRSRRNTNRQPDPIATMSRYRYKAMMRHLVDQSRVGNLLRADAANPHVEQKLDPLP